MTNYDEFSNWENAVIGVIAGISIVCVVIVRYQVWKGNAPFAYSQPNNLIIKKGTWEIIICFMYIITPIINDKYLYTSKVGNDDDTNQIVTSTKFSAVLSFLSQFSTAASELIVLQMCQELYIAASNPFASKRGSTNFNVTVLLPSFIISAALIYCGPEVFGLSNLGFCWIQDRFMYVFFFFYLWVIILYPFAFIRIYQAKSLLKKSLKSLEGKKKSLNNCITALWFYLIQWLVVLLLLFANMHNAPGACWFGSWRWYCEKQIPREVIDWLRPIAALSLATRGILSYSLLWYINRKDLQKRKTTLWNELFRKATRKEKSQALLNEYLRQEILFYTSIGIRRAVKYLQDDDKDEMFRFSNNNSTQASKVQTSVMRISGRGSRGSTSEMDLSNDNEYDEDKEQHEQESSTQERSSLFNGEDIYDHSGTFTLKGHGRTTLSNGFLSDLFSCHKRWKTKAPSFLYMQYFHRADEDVLEAQTRSAQFYNKMSQIISNFGIQYFLDNPRLKRKSTFSSTSLFGTSLSANTPPTTTTTSNNDNKANIRNNNKTNSSKKSGGEREEDSDIRLDISKIRNTFSELNPETRTYRSDYDEYDGEPSSIDNLYSTMSSITTLNQASPRSDHYDNIGATSKAKMTLTMNQNNNKYGGMGKKPPQNKGLMENLLETNQIHSDASNNSINIKQEQDQSIQQEQEREQDKICNENENAINDYKSTPSSSKGNQNKRVIFTDYEPYIFREIRKIFSVDDQTYMESFSSITKEKFSEGKSGAFMYYSHNEKYIVKTTTRCELKNLLKIIPKYLDHIRQYPHTFIVKFLSAHSVTIYDNTIYFFVMGNFFATQTSIDEYYDLKGSYVDRKADVPIAGKKGKCRYCNNYFIIGDTKGPSRKTYCYKRGMIMKHEVSLCLKDNDVVRKCIFPPNTASNIRQQLKLDSKFLGNLNLMDYSLILGVHHSKFRVVVNPAQFVEEEKKEMMNGGDYSNSYSFGNDSEFVLSDVSVAESFKEKNGLDSLLLIKEPENAIDNNFFRKETETTTITNNPLQEKDKKNKNGDGEEINTPFNPYGMQTDGALAAALVEAPSFYYIGIVDILQEWTWEKKLENFYKRIRGKSAEGISAIEPNSYCQRFQDRVVDSLIQGALDKDQIESMREAQALQSLIEEKKYMSTLDGGERKRLVDVEGTIKEIWTKFRGLQKQDKDDALKSIC